MASGLAALLDDVAAIAKLAAASLDDVTAAAGKAGSKAIGVVVDDAAVTPGYAMGFTPERELPIVWKIALGSLRNKFLFLLPGALLLSAFAPWAVTPILMLGGAYLCFEATEKIIEAIVALHDETDGAGGRRPRAELGGARGAEGGRRHSHRPDPVGRDHGDRARRRSPTVRSRSRPARWSWSSLALTRRRLRRGRSDREDGRHRRAPGAASLDASRAPAGARSSSRCLI